MAAETRTWRVEGTRLLLDDAPFYWQGLSFFNALYNPVFTRSPADQEAWLVKFLENGVNALRVWCQWDFAPPRSFVDVAPDHIMYTPEGQVRDKHFGTLVDLLLAADAYEVVIEVVLFSHEKQPNMSIEAQERAASEMAKRLRPYRNVLLQIWNEDSTNVAGYYEAIKAQDRERIVTNAPGFANVLGDETQNEMLDLLTPHTVRRGAKFWEVAPEQIAGLLTRYDKPVIDDEPARTGLVQFGGIEGGTQPTQHITQIQRVREVGGYHTYHHDMFQNGYGSPATPPTGIPDPDFRPFHRQVFDYLRDHKTW